MHWRCYMVKRNKVGFFNRILNTIKRNWYLFVIAALGIVIFGMTYIHGGKLSGLINSLGTLSDNYRKQVKTIDKLSEKKSASDKKAIKDSKKNLKEIEARGKESLENIEKEKQKTVDNLKKKKSKELAKKVKDEFKL